MFSESGGGVSTGSGVEVCPLGKSVVEVCPLGIVNH